MSSLQKVNLGTPPKAEDGDAVRVANVKANANVDVLNAQSALTSAAQLVDSAQALTAALHLGRRVNISLAVAGIVQVPAAATCGTDGVMLLRNIGATVVTLAITTGSGDTLSLSKLNPGETALVDTDGVHAWTVLMRGRTNSDNETVNGNCAVGGNETVAGALGVIGLTTLTGGASFGAGGQATISAAGAYSGVSAAYSGNVTVGGTLGVTGQATFTLRPTFASNTPWDSGNLPSPASSVGMVSGATVAAGRVGEIKIASQPSGGLSAGAAAAVIGVLLTPGNWLVWATAAINVSSGSASDFTIGVSTTSGFAGIGTYVSSAASAISATLATPPVPYNVSSSTTVNAVGRCNAAAGVNCTIYAMRMV
ncbi:hypothetical protein NE850_18235 [Paraburkholderia sp. USG1]|uniref:hypothetical protein n=1 Tax=Paraburkholderia sp. USG1 TaxID=2952268 RepID=UPI002858DE91|nr:hypothetical protein [Paraburkholderia sp. USG1]MDR8398284.1 hypothetical protein [Paraburkholderia sp. USG1]